MSTQRVKDAGFLQQNIEKLALAAGAFVLVLAIVLFVFGNPFKVEVGGKKYGDANQAIGELKRADSEIENGLANQSPLPVVTAPKFDDEYQNMIRQAVNSPNAVGRLTRNGLTKNSMNPPPVEPPRYTMVFPPATQDVEYVFGYDVLDVEFNQQIVDEFFALWGERREPADFPMMIAAGDFDIWEWVNRLKAEEEEGAEANADNKIPLGIWSKRFGVAGVALLREEWDEQGEIWTNRQYVSALPGQSRLLPMDDAPTKQYEALQTIELLRQAQSEVTRPELPWLVDYVQAHPPGGEDFLNRDDGFQLGIEGELGQNEQRIVDLEEKIKLLEERRRAQEERRRPRPDRPERPVRRPRGGDGGEFEDGGDFDDGGFDGGGNDRGERRDPIQRQIDRLQEQIERYRPQAEREREERQKQAEKRRIAEEKRRAQEALRLEREGAAGFENEFANLGGLGFEGVEVQEGSKIRVWAADPTMRPGMTYRYKLVVAVINPLYGVPRLESEQLAENQARAAIFPSDEEIEAMPWSEAVTVEPRAQFFLTSGNEARASLDIYRRHAGELVKQRFDVSPGDPIGGVVTIKDKEKILPPMDVDMGIGAVLIDITRRRDLSGNPQLTMIYMDEQGNLYERTQAEDANNPAKRDLDREVKDGPEQVLRPDEDEQGFDDGGFDGGGFDGFDEFR